MNRTPVADWQQLSALYEQADALDPVSLDDWLLRLRQEAHPLLAQLEQMLSARQQIRGNGFLGALPHLPTRTEARTIDWHGGSRIGPYRLLRKIGSGGMAEVWLAQRDDGAFQRQVAIKLLFRNNGSDQRDSFAQRFDRERDILASLDHPHIAGLHDAGVTPNGQPWIALEYVEGQTLTTWCDARHLTVDARVRLFRQVLLAVQHAHANLVIHRDLKPGNILVTAQGEVRLLDFGIAKLMEPEGGALIETELTRIAGRPMTPQYAAPEQLLGQPLTTACDVYSLGVVLYELLCGERPYELKIESAAQLEQAILDTEPRAPSRRALSEPIATARGTTGPTLRKVLASDLDAIVLRALAKQPTQRYGSVEAMRADLDRWLGGEPVEARTPSTVYRVGKFVRRHTLSVSLGVGAVVALAGVAAVAVVMGLQAREDSARAVAARDFMLNIFQRANQEKSRGADVTARDMLETGRKDVLSRLAGQPRLQAELLRGIAKIQGEMGEYVTADATFAELVLAHQRLHQPREQMIAQIDRALNAVSMNSPDKAQRFLDDAASMAGRPVGDAEIAADLAKARGWIALNSGKPDEALKVLSKGREDAAHALGPNDLRTFRLDQAMVRALRDRGEIESALILQEQLRQSARHVGGLGADEFAYMDWEQVNLLSSAGQFANSLRLSDEVLPRCVAELGPQAQQCRYLVVKRAQMLLKLGKLGEVDRALPQLQPIADDAALPFLQIEALVLELRLRSILNDDADPALNAVYDRVRSFGRGKPSQSVQPSLRAGALLALAEARLRVSDPERARNWISEALDLLNDQIENAASSRTGANARMLMGVALIQQRRPEEALARLLQAHDYFLKALGHKNPTTQFASLNLALALNDVHRTVEAERIVMSALPILQESLGVDAPTYKRVANLLDLWKHPRSMGPVPRPDRAGESSGSDELKNARSGREFFVG